MRQATTQDLDYFVNHPRIAPMLGLPWGSSVSMRPFYDRPRNMAFCCGAGAMAFAHLDNDTFESHLLFIPGLFRGADLKAYAKQMLDAMFTQHNARVIVGYPPRGHRAVRIFAIALGYKKIPNVTYTDGLGRECDKYELRQDTWETS